MKTYNRIQEMSAWIQKQVEIIKTHNQDSSILKVVDVKSDPNSGEPLFEVQLKGKNLFVTKKSSELVAGEQILNAFSKKDILLISNAHQLYISSPAYKVTGHYYHCSDCIVTMIEKNGQQKSFNLEEIGRDKKFWSSLSSTDSHIVGYLLGYEDGKQVRS